MYYIGQFDCLDSGYRFGHHRRLTRYGPSICVGSGWIAGVIESRISALITEYKLDMENELTYDEKTPAPHDLQMHEVTIKLALLNSRHLPADALALSYDRDGEWLAIGCKNGTKLLYDIKERKFVARADDVRDNSITSIKWRPSVEGKSKILVTADAGGFITFFHAPSLKPLFTLPQEGNSLHSIDFSPSAKHFATGGKDFHVRLYDEQTKTVSFDFKPAGWNNVGHDNRVFAVRFIDEHTLISGGWDSVVHIWDLRLKKSARHFYGPNISGESLDYQDGHILTGSYAAQKQLQLWDFRTLQKVEEIDWTGNIDDAEYLYAASFSRRDPTLFGAGSTGAKSEVRLYREGGSSTQHILGASIHGLNQGCFSLDFCSKADQFAFSTPHHGLYVYSYHKQ